MEASAALVRALCFCIATDSCSLPVIDCGMQDDICIPFDCDPITCMVSFSKYAFCCAQLEAYSLLICCNAISSIAYVLLYALSSSSMLFDFGGALPQELSTISMPQAFLPLACTANLAKNLAAVAASSTRAPIYRTFALQNNLAGQLQLPDSSGQATTLCITCHLTVRYAKQQFELATLCLSTRLLWKISG